MIRNAFDETGKNLLRLILGRVFHGRPGKTFGMGIQPGFNGADSKLWRAATGLVSG